MGVQAVSSTQRLIIQPSSKAISLTLAGPVGPTGIQGPAGSSFPPGTVMATVGATPDVGFVFLDGGTIVNGEFLHPELWLRLPTSWKVGHDILLADMRGRGIIGAGTGAGLTARTLGALLGEETHLLTSAESGIPAHNHTQNAHTHVQDSHNHTQVAHNHAQDSHNHTQNAHNHADNGHAHTVLQDSGGTYIEYKTVGAGTAVNALVLGGSGGTDIGLYAGFSAAVINAFTAINNAQTATNQAATATNNATTATNQNATATNNANTAANAASAHNNIQPSIVLNWQIKL